VPGFQETWVDGTGLGSLVVSIVVMIEGLFRGNGIIYIFMNEMVDSFLGSNILVLGSKILVLDSKILVLGSNILVLGSKILLLI
jgi:hypothetical protein